MNESEIKLMINNWLFVYYWKDWSVNVVKCIVNLCLKCYFKYIRLKFFLIFIWVIFI